VQAWPTSTVSTPFTVTDQRPDEGVVTVATEDYASWLPGVSFTSPLLDGTYTSAGVEFRFDGEGQFRLDVLTGQGNRLASALEAVIARQVERARFLGRYEYTISSPTSTTVDATPVDTSLGLPELQAVPICADSISSYVPPDGGTCHIMFLNGRRSRPVCVWTDEAPTMAQILKGAIPVALQGSTVTVLWPGAIPIAGYCSTLPPPGTFTGTLTITSPGMGVIDDGSTTVSATP
jgi:hypothetical protein